MDAAQTGTTYKAIVDDPVMVSGDIAIPRDARATLQAVSVAQSGKMKGSDKIQLKLNSVSFGGKTHQLTTEYATVQGKGEGKKTTRKVAGGAGLGALIGGNRRRRQGRRDWCSGWRRRRGGGLRRWGRAPDVAGRDTNAVHAVGNDKIQP